jgi:hypothetical protein
LAGVFGHLGGFFNLSVKPELQLIGCKRHLGRGDSVLIGAPGQRLHQRTPRPGIGKQLAALGLQRMIISQSAIIQRFEASLRWLQHPDNEEAASSHQADDKPDQNRRRFQA